MFKYWLSLIFIFFILISCFNNCKSNGQDYNKSDTTIKINGVVSDNQYYNSKYDYKIALPSDWEFFTNKDYINRVRLQKGETYLFGMKKQNSYLMAIDVELKSQSFAEFLANSKKTFDQGLLKIKPGYNVTVIPEIIENSNGCLKEFLYKSYATNDHSFITKFCAFFKKKGTHVLALIEVDNDHEENLSKTLNSICEN